MKSLFRHWFRSTSASFRRRTARVSPRRVHLGLEHLEDRLVPSTFNVNSLADMLNPPAGTITLRSAIQMANQTSGSNTINLQLAGTYKITLPATGAHDNAGGAFTIIPNAMSPAGSTLTIRNMSGGTVVVDGNHLDRIFDINPNNVLLANAPFTVVMQGFTVQNGIAQPGDAAQGSGGGIRDQANVNLTLTNMTVTNNLATADGGGIAMENPTVSTVWTLTVNNSMITNNHAGDAGGGVETDGSGTDLINSGTMITGNTCMNQGGGIWLDAIADNQGNQQGASLTVIGAMISGNQALSAGGLGGGIGNAGNGAVNISNSTVANNFAGMNGGGFGDENFQGSLTVQNCSFLNNTTVGIGGGIASGGPVNIFNSTVANNFAGATGGGFGDENALQLDSLTAQNSTFLNNTAVGAGGGIAAAGMTTLITSTEIDGNTSGGAGGGLFTKGTTLTLQQSTLANNTASDNGGGIELATTGAADQGSTITNTTLTGNRALNNAGANGGGVDAGAGFTGDLLLLNDTINANFASMGGGIFWAATLGSTFRLQNTIVAGNFATTGPDAAANLLFTSALDGKQQVPPVTTNATGTTTVVLSPDQTTLSFSLTFANLSGAPAAAHLHNAPAGQNGPIATDANGNNIELQNLPNDTNGTVGPQTFTVNAPFVAQLVQGNIYANVHTAKFPDGEIRGQLAMANGVFTDLGGNFIGVSGPGSGNQGFTSAATQTGTLGNPLDPQLGPLQDNGGPAIGAPGHTMTLQTEMLQDGSKATGKGLIKGAPAQDERGFASVVDGAMNVGATSAVPKTGFRAAHPPAWDGSLEELAALLLEAGTDKKDG
jgi:hypothetical protein